MAKRKKGSKKSGSRRRVSGVGGDVLKIIGGAVGGALLGRMIATKVTALSPKIMYGIQAAAGVFGAMKIKNPLIKGAGIGLAVNGAIGEAQQFGIISGIGDAPAFNPASNRILNRASQQRQVGDVYYPQPNVVGAFPSLSVVGGTM